jgi:hypothetical protein
MDQNLQFYIEACKKQIENNLAWGPAEQWKQRDFNQLCELIFEKTGTRLSISTIKRLWDGTFLNTPQPATLNAIAQFAGFRSWNDFKSESRQMIAQKTEPEKQRQRINRFKAFLRITAIPVTLLLVLCILFWRRSEQLKNITVSEALNTEVKFTHKILADGIPNTVVFSFDISKVKADSFFFQQTWDYQTRVKIPSGSKFFTSIYYYPGYHTAKLFAGETQIAKDSIHIKTKGWQGVLVAGPSQSIPSYFRDSIPDGILYLPITKLPKSEQLESKKEYFVRYYNIQDFDSVYGDSFTLKAGIKNDIEHGALTCQDIRLYLFCNTGMIIVPFSMPGCVGNLNLIAGDHILTGKNNDLSALGVNLSVWQNIIISSSGKIIRIATNNTSFSTTYTSTLGKIMGVMIEFKGTGAVDYFELYNPEGKMLYNDNF